MIKTQSKTMWEMVSVPKNAIARQFASEKTGKNFCEIVMPDNVPDVGGWHFYMPESCVEDGTDGSVRLLFLPSWLTIRFLSPYVPGKRSNIIDFPIDFALSLFREVFRLP